MGALFVDLIKALQIAGTGMAIVVGVLIVLALVLFWLMRAVVQVVKRRQKPDTVAVEPPASEKRASTRGGRNPAGVRSNLADRSVSSPATSRSSPTNDGQLVAASEPQDPDAWSGPRVTSLRYRITVDRKQFDAVVEEVPRTITPTSTGSKLATPDGTATPVHGSLDEPEPASPKRQVSPRA